MRKPFGGHATSRTGRSVIEVAKCPVIKKLLLERTQSEWLTGSGYVAFENFLGKQDQVTYVSASLLMTGGAAS